MFLSVVIVGYYYAKGESVLLLMEDNADIGLPALKSVYTFYHLLCKSRYIPTTILDTFALMILREFIPPGSCILD